jgi:pilus assembly protein CpaE
LVGSVRRVYQLGASRRQAMPAVQAPTGEVPRAEAAPSADGKIVTVFSSKGGVGCSTIAVNMAIALQQNAANKVVIVDTSLQFGDVGVLLNLYASRTIADLAAHADELDDELINDIFIPHSSGVKALLAPPRPEVADTVTPALIISVLERLRKMFDVIIVDTGSILDDMVLNVLDVSDKIIVVTTPEIPAIKDAKLFFEVTEALEYERERFMFVLNKTDKRINIRAEDIAANIKYNVESQLPLDERSVTTAVNQGVPYVLGSKNSLLAQATIDLSKRLLELLSPATEEVGMPVRAGIFGR